MIWQVALWEFSTSAANLEVVAEASAMDEPPAVQVPWTSTDAVRNSESSAFGLDGLPQLLGTSVTNTPSVRAAVHPLGRRMKLDLLEEEALVPAIYGPPDRAVSADAGPAGLLDSR